MKQCQHRKKRTVVYTKYQFPYTLKLHGITTKNIDDEHSQYEFFSNVVDKKKYKLKQSPYRSKNHELTDV